MSEYINMYYNILACTLILPAAGLGFEELDPSDAAAAIPDTQITVRLGAKQFQATVVAKDGGSVTIVTAAHCVSAREAGLPILLVHADRQLRGRLVRAVQNPGYRPVTSRDARSNAVRGVLCVDNAVATIEVHPANQREQEVFRQLRQAELAAAPLPEGPIQTLTVHIYDQDGQAHVVKAGNHLNPKCLAWGSVSYHPMPGDSGAGVFLMRQNADGQTTPLLIGNVALSDNRGGIAPLVSRRSRWVDEAFTGTGGQSRPGQNRPTPP
jgi:Trypsin